ncbi:MAG: ImmA/IrrE family metallo-endopeptidase [Holophagales bacterium]|nr:ImmA/IrrE family metallo-endopeptidase [Holophagales bacterium]
MNPGWYGQKYPTLDDLVDFGSGLGADICFDRIVSAVYFAEAPPLILIPVQHGSLATMWALAHELGHLCQHSGPKGRPFWGKDEYQANKWAACALIPEARIQLHQNASVDNFIAALSANYEDIPPIDCHARNLAYKIACHRLDVLNAKGFYSH